jgi:endo-1,4-beta-xylanase
MYMNTIKYKLMKMKHKLLLSLVLCAFSGIAVLGTDLPVVVEAESGTVGSSFDVVESSGVTYVTIKYSSSTTAGAIRPDSVSRVMTYSVTFPDSGTYDLYARLYVGPNNFSDDSYFYGNGFGLKDVTDSANWVRANMLSGAGYSTINLVVDGGGSSSNSTWVWLNMSKFALDLESTSISFRVEKDQLTQSFQIAGREDGLRIDKFIFGRKGYSFTVDNLDKGQAGSLIIPGQEPIQNPIAIGNAKFLGCAYGSNSKYNFTSYWNQVTPENASKWGSVEGARDVMNWKSLDEAYHFAMVNKFPFKIHTLVWGNQQPTWIESLDSAQQRQEIEEWFAAVAERYDTIDYIEVVNEPLHDPPVGSTNGNYAKALGGNGKTGWDWVIEAFKMARYYFPKSQLLINEFSVTNSTESMNKYIQIINLLKTDSLIDGVGVQAHSFSLIGVSAATTKANLDLLAATGLPIYATEMDIDGTTDASQLKEYMKTFPVFWEHPSVKGVTMWGYRPGMWRTDTKAYLITADRIIRPALLWLRAYVNGTYFAITGITVTSADNATGIDVKGDSLQMIANVLPINATLNSVVWSVNDKSIATISSKGMLKPITNGTVTVTATSMELNSAVKGTKIITFTNQPVSVEDIFQSNVSIYPNPVTNEVRLQNADNIVEIEILNLYGQKILSAAKPEDNIIKVSGLKSGIYFLTSIDKNGSRRSTKFIKNAN